MLKWIGRLALWLFLGLLALQFWFFAHIIFWHKSNPSSTSFMDLRLSQLQAKNPNATLKHQWVAYSQISNHLKRAVIAAEDSGFTQHHGVEWKAIESALERNLERGKVTHGGSTITQQLAKNLFLSPERSYIRKAQELVIALMIEATWSKQRILEVYLNVVEWGNGVFGAQAAALHYYGVGAGALGSYQSARLAGMLPSPRYFDRNRGSQFLARKTGTIQARMHMVAIPR
ncbi:MAG: monofunctional biosynthetic peptidoglycan transglycosylase [Limnobacter sp.]|nr:monofunctional biosynthetic peptidoglycan transglycosylase [Limnobacter sp.]